MAAAINKRERLHIGIFGRQGVGKTSLIHALTGTQEHHSPEPGPGPERYDTEIPSLGPVVFLDTNGIDLEGEPLDLTKDVMKRIDVALVIFDDDMDFDIEKEWVAELTDRQIPIIGVINKNDVRFFDLDPLQMVYHFPFVRVSAKQRKYMGSLFAAIQSVARTTTALRG